MRLVWATATAFCASHSLLVNTAVAVEPQTVVSVFDRAMRSGPDADRVEKIGQDMGLRTLAREMEKGHVSYLEMVDQGGDLYLVAYGEIRDLGQGVLAKSGRILVTLYDTDERFFRQLRRIARAALPDGPKHKLSDHDVGVKGIAWGAGYPGVITLEVKYFVDESASQIDADWLHSN